MIATAYHKKRLGRLLKTGDAWIEGRVSGGIRGEEARAIEAEREHSASRRPDCYERDVR